MHVHFIGGLDDLPEPIRRMLAEHGDDSKELRQIKHEILKRQEAQFWEGLTFEQTHWISRVLSMIEGSEEPGQTAARHLGTAEAYLAQRFKSCGCGEIHRDPDDFMRDLVNKTRQVSAEDRELEEFSLGRIPHHPLVPPDDHGKFHCIKCNTVFDSVDDRKKAAIGSTHPGCIDSSD